MAARLSERRLGLSAFAVTVACLIAAAGPGRAQEARKPAGVTTVLIERVRYKAGTASRLRELNEKYFYPSWRAVGLGVQSIAFASGRWDRMYIVPLKEGFGALEAKTLPEWVPAMNWRIRQFGQAEADRIEQEYLSMIEEEDDEIAVVDN